MPDVADAAAREVVRARVQVGDDWRPSLLFVVDDFNDLHLNQFYQVSGTWAPPTGSVLLERSAVGMAKAATGATLRIMGPSGTTATLATMLNFDITDQSVPHWVYVVQVIAGLVVPMMIAAHRELSRAGRGCFALLRSAQPRRPPIAPRDSRCEKPWL